MALNREPLKALGSQLIMMWGLMSSMSGRYFRDNVGFSATGLLAYNLASAAFIPLRGQTLNEAADGVQEVKFSVRLKSKETPNAPIKKENKKKEKKKKKKKKKKSSRVSVITV